MSKQRWHTPLEVSTKLEPHEGDELSDPGCIEDLLAS